MCSTSSQVTLSSFGFIYKRNEFSLRGAAEKQLYAPAPVSSSDEDTPPPEASRDAATRSAWQDGGHAGSCSCEQTGDGPHVSPLRNGERDGVKQTLRRRVHTKAKSHVGLSGTMGTLACWRSPTTNTYPLRHLRKAPSYNGDEMGVLTIRFLLLTWLCSEYLTPILVLGQLRRGKTE